MPDNGLDELVRLTDGETQLIKRRRLGENQLQAATRHNISHSMYGKWERGVVPCPKERVLPLKAYEKCLLYRRRVGYSQERVAKELKVCRWWFNQMERGTVNYDVLVAYWEC